MSAQNNGGPAFPHPDYLHAGPGGMTLRDYFAAQAMANFFVRNRQREPISSADEVASASYALADAMLKARMP